MKIVFFVLSLAAGMIAAGMPAMGAVTAQPDSLEFTLPFEVAGQDTLTLANDGGSAVDFSIHGAGEDGFWGQYYKDQQGASPEIGDLALERIDSLINFDWNDGEPDPNVGADYFSVRWTAYFFAENDGNYLFRTTTDDGVRLWIDDTQVIDDWNDHGPQDDNGNLELDAGLHHMMMEYYENGGGANAHLKWEPPGAGDYSYLHGFVGVPWLAVDPEAGSIDGGGSVDVAVSVVTKDLQADKDYAERLVIETTDPDTPELEVPVALHVTAWQPGEVQFEPERFVEALDDEETRDVDLVLHSVGEGNYEFTTRKEGDNTGWLTVKPDTGTVGPGEDMTLTLRFSSGGLPWGVYGLNLIFTGNDPDNPEETVPVTMSIGLGSGAVYGQVTNAANGELLGGAEVGLEGYAFYAVADDSGRYRIEGVPAYHYRVWATSPHFLKWRSDQFDVAEGEESEINPALLHGEFASDPNAISESMKPDEQKDVPLTLINNGNGPLTWALDIVFPEGGRAHPWDLRKSVAAGEIVDDNRIQGAVFIDGYFYVAGGEHDTNFVYVIDGNDSLVSKFRQRGSTRYGYADLEYDGELIWGTSGNVVYGFNTKGDSVTSFVSPVNNPSAIAWDPDDSLYWISGLTSDIYGVNRQGHQVGQRIRLANFLVYGLAYYPDDPDGRPLYIFRDYGDTMMVTKTSTTRSDTMLVARLLPEKGGKAGGAYITRAYDPYSWVLITTANSTNAQLGGDRVDVWQVATNTSWISVNPMQGQVDAQGSRQITVSLNSADLQPANMQCDLHIAHDGFIGEATVPLTLQITPLDTNPPPENHPPSAFDLLLPADSTWLDVNSPDPITFAWRACQDPDPEDTPFYYLWLQYHGHTATLPTADTTLTLYRDSLHIPIEADTTEMLEWWVVAISGPDTTGSNRDFHVGFRIVTSVKKEPAPVEFGLNGLYPNPFNGRLEIVYGMDVAGEADLAIYDLAGRRIAALASGLTRAGWHHLTWQAGDVPSGVYVVRLADAMRVQTRKVVLVR